MTPDARPFSPMRWVLLIVLACIAAMDLSACSTVRALERIPGADLSLVKVGATRAQVETVLGDPQREWVTRTGVRYCLYRYEADIEPSPSLAAGTVLVNIATLGLYEAMVAAGPPFYNDPRRHERVLIAVAYDAGNTVLVGDGLHIVGQR